MKLDPNDLRRLAGEPIGSEVAALQADVKSRNDMLSAAADVILQVESDLRELRRAIRYAPAMFPDDDGHLAPTDHVFPTGNLVALVPLDEGGDPAQTGPGKD